jgi:hypothetical protein
VEKRELIENLSNLQTGIILRNGVTDPSIAILNVLIGQLEKEGLSSGRYDSLIAEGLENLVKGSYDEFKKGVSPSSILVELLGKLLQLIDNIEKLEGKPLRPDVD